MNITACIITNERNVRKAINSVRSSCNEIIVVNTSEDNKFADYLSRIKGIKVYYYKWNNSFSDARNYSISKATGDWVLILDSDEVLEKPIQKLSNDYDFYFCRTRNFKKLDYWTIRLFKNKIGITFKNKVHESLEHCVKQERGIRCAVRLIHSGYDITAEQMQAKLKRNYDLMIKDLENPVRNYHIACFHGSQGNKKEAIQWGLKVLNDKVNNEHKAQICNMIYSWYNELGFTDVGLELLMESIKLVPKQIGARLQLINFLYRQKQKQLVIDELNKLKLIEVSGLPVDIILKKNFIKNKLKEISKWQ